MLALQAAPPESDSRPGLDERIALMLMPPAERQRVLEILERRRAPEARSATALQAAWRGHATRSQVRSHLIMQEARWASEWVALKAYATAGAPGPLQRGASSSPGWAMPWEDFDEVAATVPRQPSPPPQRRPPRRTRRQQPGPVDAAGLAARAGAMHSENMERRRLAHAAAERAREEEEVAACIAWSAPNRRSNGNRGTATAVHERMQADARRREDRRVSSSGGASKSLEQQAPKARSTPRRSPRRGTPHSANTPIPETPECPTECKIRPAESHVDAMLRWENERQLRLEQKRLAKQLREAAETPPPVAKLASVPRLWELSQPKVASIPPPLDRGPEALQRTLSHCKSFSSSRPVARATGAYRSELRRPAASPRKRPTKGSPLAAGTSGGQRGGRGVRASLRREGEPIALSFAPDLSGACADLPGARRAPPVEQVRKLVLGIRLILRCAGTAVCMANLIMSPTAGGAGL